MGCSGSIASFTFEAGHRAAHEHDERRADRFRLGDRAAVVVERLPAFRRRLSGKKSAAAERHDRQALVADHARYLGRIAARDRVTPHRDALHAGRGEFLHRRLDRPRLGCDGVDAEALRHGKFLGAGYCLPPDARASPGRHPKNV
jgi:hypothetical protein